MRLYPIKEVASSITARGASSPINKFRIGEMSPIENPTICRRKKRVNNVELDEHQSDEMKCELKVNTAAIVEGANIVFNLSFSFIIAIHSFIIPRWVIFNDKIYYIRDHKIKE